MLSITIDFGLDTVLVVEYSNYTHRSAHQFLLSM